MKHKNRLIEMLLRVVSKCVSCLDKTHFKRNGTFKLPKGDILFHTWFLLKSRLCKFSLEISTLINGLNLEFGLVKDLKIKINADFSTIVYW